VVEYKILFNEMKTLSVLLVEDFKPLRLEMGEVLESICKTVSIAEEGQKALFLYEQALQEGHTFDLVISDIQMPVMDGIQLSKKIREQNENQAIIILSAHSDSEYLVDLINIGISKFLTKPINHDDLCDILYSEGKKLNRQKTKIAVDSPNIILAPGYVWNMKTMVLTHNDLVIDLTKHELLLLQYFLHKKDYICSNMDIMEDFYNQNIEISEKNIRNLIFKLRKKIPKECIVSVYGLGYKLVSKT
jgi:DNA-binding response OmpR family regulator